MYTVNRGGSQNNAAINNFPKIFLFVDKMILN